MSDKTRRRAGCALMIISLLAAAVPWDGWEGAETVRYGHGRERTFLLTETGTEQNGSIAVNRADEETLQSLPGIGPAYAQRIIEERDQNGAFHYPEDLEAVSGIGPKTLDGIRSMIDMTLNEGGN